MGRTVQEIESAVDWMGTGLEELLQRLQAKDIIAKVKAIIVSLLEDAYEAGLAEAEKDLGDQNAKPDPKSLAGIEAEKLVDTALAAIEGSSPVVAVTVAGVKEAVSEETSPVPVDQITVAEKVIETVQDTEAAQPEPEKPQEPPKSAPPAAPEPLASPPASEHPPKPPEASQSPSQPIQATPEKAPDPAKPAHGLGGLFGRLKR